MNLCIRDGHNCKVFCPVNIKLAKYVCLCSLYVYIEVLSLSLAFAFAFLPTAPPSARTSHFDQQYFLVISALFRLFSAARVGGLANDLFW